MANGDFLHLRQGLFEIPIRPARPARIISSGSWIKPWTVREEQLPIRIYEDIFNNRRATDTYFLDEYTLFKSNEIELMEFLSNTNSHYFKNINNLRSRLYSYNPPMLLRAKFNLIYQLEKLLDSFHERKIA